jgi:hypothetical protein
MCNPQSYVKVCVCENEGLWILGKKQFMNKIEC